MPRQLLRPIHYDAARKRLWILGQRCHHGATGALLAVAGGAAAVKASPSYAALIITGGVLMAHDWHDRSIWFQPGWQNQP